MTVVIQTAELQNALKLVSAAVGASQTLEGSDTICFTEGFAHSFSGTVSVSAPIKDADGNPAQLAGVVKAKQFCAWVAKLKGDLITVEVKEDGSWELTCGRSSSRPAPIVDQISAHLAALDLGNLTWADLPEDFQSAVTLVRMDAKPGYPVWLRVKHDLVMSTDSKYLRMASYQFPDTVDLGDYAIGTDYAKAIANTSDLCQFATSQGWAHFLSKSGMVLTVQTAVGSSVYRDDTHLTALDKVSKGEAIMETELPVGTADAVGRVCAFASDDKDSGTTKVYMTMKPESLSLTTKRMEGEALEVLEWPVRLPEGTDSQMALSAPFILEAANRGVKLRMVRVVVGVNDGEEVVQTFPTFANDKYLQIVRPLAV